MTDARKALDPRRWTEMTLKQIDADLATLRAILDEHAQVMAERDAAVFEANNAHREKQQMEEAWNEWREMADRRVNEEKARAEAAEAKLAEVERERDHLDGLHTEACSKWAAAEARVEALEGALLEAQDHLIDAYFKLSGLAGSAAGRNT